MSYLKIRKMIEGKIPNLNEKEFFLSADFKRYIENLVQATTMRYKKPISVIVAWDEREAAKTAWTDNNVIWLNSGNRIISRLDSIQKKAVYLIALTAHETGHILYSDFDRLSEFKKRVGNGVFLSEDDRVDEIKEYIKGLNKKTREEIVKIFQFVLNVLEDYYVDNLICINFPGTFKKAIEYKTLIHELHESEETLNIFFNHMIFYNKKGFCEINNLKKEYQNTLETCFGIIDSLKKNDNTLIEEREKAAELIVFELWKYITEILDKINSSETNQDTRKELEEFLNQIFKNSEINTSNSTITNSININNFLDEKAIKVIVKTAEKEVNKDMENELYNKIKKESSSIDYDEIHKGIKVEIKRKIDISDEEIKRYNLNFKHLFSYTKKLKNNYSRNSKLKELNNKVYGLRGKRFDIKSAYRNEVSFYSRNNTPNKLDLSVALLVDESGSMCAYNRIKTAKEAAFILYEFCRYAEIPIAIYGHTEALCIVEMYSYVEFDSVDGNDKYRIANIKSREENRDGLALKFLYERLIKRKEKRKILIVISDGQPCGKNYGGKSAEKDIRKIKLEYYRKGIITFAAAIGEDKNNIKRIYQDGYLDISDLNKLPQNLIKLINTYIK